LLIDPRDLRPTLASQAIDKHLAHQARVLGALSEKAFERALARNPRLPQPRAQIADSTGSAG
jgi:hypothetical protein